MLGNLKPVPRFLLIIAIIGGIVYGVHQSGILKTIDQPTQQDVETKQTESTQEVPKNQRVETTQQVPPVQEQTTNAGIDALLSQGSKK